jgi:hypothetical protein
MKAKPAVPPKNPDATKKVQGYIKKAGPVKEGRGTRKKK